MKKANEKLNVLSTIHMTQPRIATGKDQSAKTALHLLQGVASAESVELCDGDEAKGLTGYPVYARDLGIVEIIHPWCMAGSREEVTGEMYKAAYDRLESLGIIAPNDYGIYFPVEKAAR